MTSPNSAVAVWKMSYEGQTVLVVHNFGNATPVFTPAGCSLDKKIVSNGTVTVSNGSLALGAYASAVFLQ